MRQRCSNGVADPQYDVSADGRRFVVAEPIGAPPNRPSRSYKTGTRSSAPANRTKPNGTRGLALVRRKPVGISECCTAGDSSRGGRETAGQSLAFTTIWTKRPYLAGQLLLWGLYPNLFGPMRCRGSAKGERGTVAAPSLIDRISSCPAKSYHANRLPSGFVHIGFPPTIRRS